MAKAKLTPTEATRKIRTIVDQGRVVFSDHCRRERMPDRNVNAFDVVNVLAYGEVNSEAAWDADYQNWKYRVVGVDLEGGDLIAITVIFEIEYELLIVTVF